MNKKKTCNQILKKVFINKPITNLFIKKACTLINRSFSDIRDISSKIRQKVLENEEEEEEVN